MATLLRRILMMILTKRFFHLLTVLLFTLSLISCSEKYADDYQGVRFVKGKSFQELLALAKTENKPVFIACHTSWCIPCNDMKNKVYPTYAMGSYFNKNAITAIYDMELGEGRKIAKQYNVTSYPTYLFLSPDGKVIKRTKGGMTRKSPILTAHRLISINEKTKKILSRKPFSHPHNQHAK